MALHSDFSLANMLSKKADIHYPFDFINDLLRREQEFPELILMEYLEGIPFSTYSLCKDGETLTCIPYIREWGPPSQSLRARVDLNSEIIDAAKAITKNFSFSYCINYEMVYVKERGIIPYDLNARLAASTACLRGLGLNIVYLSLKLALGEDFKIPEPKDSNLVTVRYFKELFVNKSRHFEI